MATVTIAAYVGLGGLGYYIIQGIALRDFPEILGASIVVIALALVLDGVFALLQRVVVPRGVTARTRTTHRTPAVPFAHRRGRAPPDSVTTTGGSTMSTARTRLALAVSATAIAALALAGCASNDPLSGDDGATEQPSDSSAIVIGSQAYYSNEIIAEIYAQALEGAGFQVERNFNIGQRDAYMPSLEDGSIDLFPEYTGNLLQFFEPDATATTPDDVYAALKDALPDGLTVLDQSPATDQDSYNVTADFAAEHNLKSIGDLAGIEGLVLGGAPELEQRPYGPDRARRACTAWMSLSTRPATRRSTSSSPATSRSRTSTAPTR